MPPHPPIPTKINLSSALSRIHEHWRPKIVADVNDHAVRLVKFKGDFIWHTHAHEDEHFHVLKGAMRIDFRAGSVTLRVGELLDVPRGLEHRTAADEEAHVLIFEPAQVRNTGDQTDDRLTAPTDARL